MKDLLVLLTHLLTTIAKLLGPGGARAIVAESPPDEAAALGHQSLPATCTQSHSARSISPGFLLIVS